MMTGLAAPQELLPGAVAVVDFGSGVGRVQSGKRPALFISTASFLEVADQLAIVLPCTTRDRGWENHVVLSGPTGLTLPTFAMTEQVMTIDRSQILRVTGRVDPICTQVATEWMSRWLA